MSITDEPHKRHRNNLKPPAKGTPSPNKGKTFPPEVLTRDEVFHLIDACSKRGSTGVRNRAIIATLYGSGIRVSECTSLLAKDIDLGVGAARTRHRSARLSLSARTPLWPLTATGRWKRHEFATKRKGF